VRWRGEEKEPITSRVLNTPTPHFPRVNALQRPLSHLGVFHVPRHKYQPSPESPKIQRIYNFEGLQHSSCLPEHHMSRATSRNLRWRVSSSLGSDVLADQQQRSPRNTTNRQCQFCDKGFLKKEHLLRHERTHTKERPFRCERCHKVFSRQ
jgi:uncharacterized Zn-finger protein